MQRPPSSPAPPAPSAPPRRQLLALGLPLLVPVLAPLLGLGGCAAPWPKVPAGAGSSSARQRLQQSAEAQGLAALRGVRDLNLGFDGFWTPQAGALTGASGAVQARCLPGQALVALSTTAAERPSGQAGPASQADAVAADLHRLLWLGAMALGMQAGPVNWAEPETLQGQRCDHLHLLLAPGLGGAAADKLSLFIDREQGWLRRLRVSLTALAGDALAELDLFEHQRLFGVAWPTRFQARLPHAASWRLTGLDVNRGYAAQAISGWPWTGAATAPARALHLG